MDTIEFINKAIKIKNNLYDNEYFLVEYIKSTLNVIITCKKHGNFLQTPNNHLAEQSCPICAEINRRLSKTKTLDEFITAANKKHNFRYDYSKTIYINAHTKVIIICNLHGEFRQTPNKHLTGDNCSQCGLLSRASLRTKTLDEFITVANKKHNFRYDYSKTIYINCKKKVIIICNLHGEFQQTPDSHLQGVGCPICNSSKGELVIFKYFTENNIEFDYQFSFDDCKNIKPLPFDFIITKDSYVYGAIEYQGIQHFKSVEYWGGEEKLEYIKRNDKIKLIYCKENDIPLLVISYKKINEIEFILSEFINKIKE